jgi:hypothetical protein
VFVFTTIPGAQGIAQLATTNQQQSPEITYPVSATAQPPQDTSDNSLQYSIYRDNNIYPINIVIRRRDTSVFVRLLFRTLGSMQRLVRL